MKKRAIALVMAMMMTASLAGCEGKTQPAQEPVATEPTAAPEANNGTPEEEPVVEVAKADDSAVGNLISATTGTVKLTVWASEEDQDLTKGLIDGFKAQYPDVTFDIQLGACSESVTKDNVLADPTAAADVFAFADDQINELVNAGALQEVAAAYTYDVSKENVAGSVAAATVNGKVYAYPMTADNGYFLYYNKSVFSDDDIKSLDKMIEVAGAANTQIGFELANAWYLFGFFSAQGTDLYARLSSDGVTNECNWNEGVGVDIANALIGYVDTGVFVKAADDASAVSNMKDGKYAAIVNGTWSAAAISEALGADYGAAKLPTFTAGGKEYQMSSFAGYKLIGVNPHSEFVGWSMLLAEYLTNEESQVARFEARGLGPANIKAAASEAVKSDPAIAAIAAQAEYATPQRIGGNFWDPAKSLGEIIGNGNPDKTDVKTLLDNAVEGINAPVASN
ncbi:MAG: extracellular solute-binding protein [Lachnospiraceae bacterium]|nr:extracellular solute-binding protein [Lachnospiraceae bacterium]